MELIVKDLICNESINSWSQYEKYSHAFALLPPITRYTFLRSAPRNNVPMKNLRIFTPFMFLVLPSTI
ncbi:predicted protein [Botrytis cinerea T4]|uniref:Uncharacterized protein n=1 Tax=Botryotinia fuckeliana (strain T4) TaxID=999810 RepID=G2XXK4_BOTF4|nr:predicted protein [Botrytis cinerea T4]